MMWCEVRRAVESLLPGGLVPADPHPLSRCACCGADILVASLYDSQIKIPFSSLNAPRPTPPTHPCSGHLPACGAPFLRILTLGSAVPLRLHSCWFWYPQKWSFPMLVSCFVLRGFCPSPHLSMHARSHTLDLVITDNCTPLLCQFKAPHRIRIYLLVSRL